MHRTDVKISAIEVTNGLRTEKTIEDLVPKLAKSIKEIGLVNPVALVEYKEGHYIIKDGCLRLMALQQMGVEVVSANVYSLYEALHNLSNIVVLSNLLRRE